MKLKQSAIALALSAVTVPGIVLAGTTGALANTGQTLQTASTIEAKGPGVFPHSADYYPGSQKFVTGSLAHGTISSVDLKGKVRTIIDDKKLVSVQAVRIDTKGNRILAGNVDYGTAERSTDATKFKVAGVAAYQIGSGRRLWYADLNKVAKDDKQHLVADVTVAPNGTAYAVDQLSSTIFRIDRDGKASVLVSHKLLAGNVDVPNFLNNVGMSAVAWMPGNILIVAKADGSLVRVPVDNPKQATKVKLSTNLSALTAGIRVLPDKSLAVVSSGLLSGKAAVVQRVRPDRSWRSATVKITDTVTDPVTSSVTPGPGGRTYALSGGLAALLAGKPNDGFTLRSVNVR
ncbi:hypothetical protein GCM10022419_013770 [Nonomuraea rosea]|uniref:SMP-30/Gluconolactonase/LRE-like region domain-containing protein n=1 Tax=Nonomuraea rosea TaxID=638574 RepID=A0ABP6VIC9_9ACTN